jgi:hypothetical protein
MTPANLNLAMRHLREAPPCGDAAGPYTGKVQQPRPLYSKYNTVGQNGRKRALVDRAKYVLYLFFMRFILRTLDHQAKLESREAISDRPDDYAVVIDGPVVGRIYRTVSEKWKWCLNSPTGAVGYADSLDAAKEAFKQRWFDETRKLSKN